MENNVKKLIQKDLFQKEQDLFHDILEVINDYQGQISLVSVLGILDLVQDELKVQAKSGTSS